MSIKIYEVGGSIRDRFLGLPNSKDRDFVVIANSYQEMRNYILEKGGEIFLEKEIYYTIRANVPGIGPCDFVLGRKDGAYYDGRRPSEVTICQSIEEELARRDFRCNAIAEDFETKEIIDPFNGIQDIKDRAIRCVGEAEDRFTEDSLRLIRAVRFKITKTFGISLDISFCLQKESLVDLLDNISEERIYDELMKCFKYDTLETLHFLENYRYLRNKLFSKNIWLSPSLKER